MEKLLIVDDHRLFADGIRFLIEHATDYEILGVLHTGQEVIPFLAQNLVGILLLDIDLPDLSGFELAKTIRHLYPDTKILALSMLSDTQSIDRMIGAGAAGYCIKSAGRDELFAAIQTVSAGGSYLPADYPTHFDARRDPCERPLLTERETQIVALITEGHSTPKIADKLFLSARTVETHRKNIYRKLGIHTNIELTLYARKINLI